MEHYQIHKQCGVCKRGLIADVFSIGTSHQNIEAITCLECAMSVKGKIMGENEIETLKVSLPELKF